jgi:hypothetical protein
MSYAFYFVLRVSSIELWIIGGKAVKVVVVDTEWQHLCRITAIIVNYYLLYGFCDFDCERLLQEVALRPLLN